MPRCFIALPIPPATRQALLRVQLHLMDSEFAATCPLRPTPESNLHLTLKFLGDTTDAQLHQLTEHLEELASRVALPTVHARGVGAFPSPTAPRAVFAEIVQGVSSLQQLGTHLDELCLPLGFAPETRRRHPHITLARVKGRPRGQPPTPLTPWLQGQQDVPFGPLCEEPGPNAPLLTLYTSELGPEGAVYHPLHSYPLNGQEKL